MASVTAWGTLCGVWTSGWIVSSAQTFIGWVTPSASCASQLPEASIERISPSCTCMQRSMLSTAESESAIVGVSSESACAASSP